MHGEQQNLALRQPNLSSTLLRDLGYPLEQREEKHASDGR
jgi:hypothetical protein